MITAGTAGSGPRKSGDPDNQPASSGLRKAMDHRAVLNALARRGPDPARSSVAAPRDRRSTAAEWAPSTPAVMARNPTGATAHAGTSTREATEPVPPADTAT